MEVCKVLVHLDCIFDTVLGTVIRMDNSLVDGLLSNGYWKRNHNQVSLLNDNIDQNEFDSLYASRDVITLRNSLRTEYLNVLQKYVTMSLSPDTDNPENVEYHITFNTYPYDLPQEELLELFVVLKEILGTKKVTRIHADPKALTLEYLSTNYQKCVFYNFFEWDGLHRAEIVATQKLLPLTIYFPCIFRPEYINKVDFASAISLTKFAFSSVVTLDIIPLNLMSVMIPADDTASDDDLDEPDVNELLIDTDL